MEMGDRRERERERGGRADGVLKPWRNHENAIS